MLNKYVFLKKDGGRLSEPANLKIKKSLIYLVSLVGFVLLLYARSTPVISDTAWHLKVGEWIVKNKSVPSVDTMSLLGSDLDLSFVAHEWLFDVAAYAVNNILGLAGILILGLFAVTLSTYIAVRLSGCEYAAVLTLAVFTFIRFEKTVEIRPDAFSAIIFVLIGYNFAYQKNFKRAAVTNALLTIALVNIHGGMASANAVQQLWILICLTVIQKRVDKDKMKLFLISLMCGLINPYGIGAYKYIRMANSEATVIFSDWNSFSFRSFIQAFLVLAVTAGCIYGYLKDEKKDKMDLCIMFMYAVLLFTYARTINIFIYAFLLYLTKYLKDFLERWEKKITLALVVCSVVVAAIILVSAKIIPYGSMDEYIDNEIVDTKLTDRINGKRYLNDITFGGFLIYKNQKPFIDTRTDPYLKEYGNPEILSEYVKAMHSEELMGKLTDKYDIEYLLLSANNITSQIFYASGDWQVVMKGQRYVLFERVLH